MATDLLGPPTKKTSMKAIIFSLTPATKKDPMYETAKETKKTNNNKSKWEIIITIAISITQVPVNLSLPIKSKMKVKINFFSWFIYLIIIL